MGCSWGCAPAVGIPGDSVVLQVVLKVLLAPCRQRQEAIARRKDAKLAHVIISERYDKKASKYGTPSVPFPYNVKEVYERSMRQPLGRDYNTDSSFR